MGCSFLSYNILLGKASGTNRDVNARVINILFENYEAYPNHLKQRNHNI